MRVSTLTRHCVRHSSSRANVIAGSLLMNVVPGIDGQLFVGRADAQRLGDQLILIAAIGEVETHQQVERFAIEPAERQAVGCELQRVPMLIERRIERIGIDVSGANPPRLDGAPAVAAQLLIGLQDEIAFVAGIEVPHVGELLLHLFEVMQNGLAAAGQLHLGAEIHADIVVVRERMVGVHR